METKVKAKLRAFSKCDFFKICCICIEKEKEHLFSVRGFETETSNFALNGCLRVSKNPKFHARSKKKSRLIDFSINTGGRDEVDRTLMI